MHTATHSSPKAFAPFSDSAQLDCRFTKDKHWHHVTDDTFFDLSKALRRELIEQGVVQNSDASKRAHYNEANLMLCSRKKENGTMFFHEDNVAQASIYHCQNKYCFDCADARIHRETRKLLSYIEAICKKHNCPCIYHIVFTLPKELTTVVLADKNQNKKLCDKMKRIIIKFILNKVNIDRFSILMHLDRHIVGKYTLMKVRPHYHYIVIAGLCIETINAKNGEFRVSTKTLNGFIPMQSIRDINNMWNKCLIKACDKPFQKSARVNIGYGHLTGTHQERREHLTRLFVYTMRGHGVEFLTTPLWYNSTTQEIVLPEYDENMLLVNKVYSIRSYVKQWVEVRNNRQSQCLGLLHSKEKFGKILGVRLVQDNFTPPIIDTEAIKIVRSCHRKNLSQTKRSTDVYLKTSTGSHKYLAPYTYRFGNRGKNKRWEIIPD